MPRQVFEKYLLGHHGDGLVTEMQLEDSRIADFFGVSKQAARVRAEDLGLLSR